MRHILLAVVIAAFVGVAFGQGHPPFYSNGGFGSVLYPGTGHAPPGTGIPPSFPSRLGANVQGRPFGFNGGGINHPNGHGRTVIVPYPLYYGGYGYGGYGYGYDQPPVPNDPGAPIVNTNTAPSVVINQNFIPERTNPVVRDYGAPSADTGDQQSSMRLYQAPPSHPYADAQPERRQRSNDDQPTLYLIAFKDHTIVQALGYWMEGSTLHYVSVEHSLNQASLDLIDRDLSQRLNDERGIEFKIPQTR